MRSRRVLDSSKSMRYLLPVGLLLTWFGISFAQVRRVDDAALKNAAKSASDGDWLSYGLTPGETRFSPLKQIDASNVKRLGLIWSYEVGDGGGDQEATPLVWNNTIFGVTMGPPITFAIDGKQYIALMGGTGGTQSLGVTNPGAVTTQQKPMLLVFGLELPKSAAAPAPHVFLIAAPQCGKSCKGDSHVTDDQRHIATNQFAERK